MSAWGFVGLRLASAKLRKLLELDSLTVTAWASESGPARAEGSCGNCHRRMFCDSSVAFLTFRDDNFHSCLRRARAGPEAPASCHGDRHGAAADFKLESDSDLDST